MNCLKTMFLASVTLSLVVTPFSTHASASNEARYPSTSSVANKIENKTNQNEYIVVLESKPLITVMRGVEAKRISVPTAFSQSMTGVGTPRIDRASILKTNSRIISARSALKAHRLDVVSRLQKMSKTLEVKSEFDTLLNGYLVSTSASKEQLEAIPGVKSVHPNVEVKAIMENALPIINAQQSWALVGGQSQAGSGVRIAIIDSGISPDHPMFDDTGMTAPASRPTDDYCATNTNFCNNKIIVARKYNPDSLPDGEFDSPKAYSGHGTHVAGIAAGREVVSDTGQTLSGVAPGAYIMVYKALWGEEGTGSSIGLIQALEDAYADGADVINNSYGLDNLNNGSGELFESVFKELEQAGVVLVSAAGNEGDEGKETISCPACVESGIAVASSTTDLIAGYIVDFGSNSALSQPGNNYVVGDSFSGTAEIAQDTDALGCQSSAWTNVSITNWIAVVNRGTCNFSVKAQNALDAGADGLVVINNEPGPNVIMEIGETVELTSTFISQEDGQALLAYLDTSLLDTISMQGSQTSSTSDSAADVISGFSSIGPNDDDSYIKPDMAAPGDLILSAVAKEDPLTPDLDYGYLGGTSMASPMVAGAAALLKQHSPNLTAFDIKGLLINGVEGDVTGSDATSTATAFETGSGRLDALASMNLTAYATVANLTSNNCQVTCRLASALKSVDTESQTWSSVVVFDDEAISGSISPSQITLTSMGDSETFEVDVNLPFDQAVGWYFGKVVWTSSAGQTITQAIAIANIATNSDQFTLTSISETATTASYRLESANFTANDIVPVSLDLVGGAVFDIQSVNVDPVENASEYSATAERVDFDINLSASGFATVSDVPFSIDLADSQYTKTTIDCNGDCDEFTAAVPVEFDHFGDTFSTLTIGSNGVAFVGDDISSSDSFTVNRRLPYSGKPDGTIAPFWADFDLLSRTDSTDTGGGEIYFMTHSNAGVDYFIVQWNKVKLYIDESNGFSAAYWGLSNEDVEFTFQLIIEVGTDKKWFNYLSIPEQPNFYTVGAESSNSMVGITSWYDGQGTLQATTNGSVRYIYTEPENVVVTFDVEKVDGAEITSFAVNDSASTLEDTSVTVDILANDLTGERVLLIAEVAGERVMDQLFEGVSDFSLDTSSVSVVAQPSNGAVSVNSNGTLVYTPTSNFVGTDNFTYSVENTEGVESQANVVVSISAVNDEPIVTSLNVPSSTAPGSTITLSVDASDVDSILSYNWNLPTGFTATVTDDASIQVSVGSNAATSSTVSVVVSDGEFSVTASSTISVSSTTTPTQSGSSGGGSTPHELLIGVLMIMSVRRWKHYCASTKTKTNG